MVVIITALIEIVTGNSSRLINSYLHYSGKLLGSHGRTTAATATTATATATAVRFNRAAAPGGQAAAWLLLQRETRSAAAYQ